MTINIGTGSGITYDANFPKPGIDQPSQQFRDNFGVLDIALGNLQTAQTGAGSVIAITTAVQSTGQVRLTTSYVNNSLKLPVGDPTPNTPSVGMIRSSGTALQFYDGTSWRDVFMKTNATTASIDTMTVAVRLTVPHTPTLDDDAVPLWKLNAVIANSGSSSNAAINGLQQQIYDVANSVTAEAVIRASADTNLQSMIGQLQANATALSTNVAVLTGTVSGLTNGLADEIVARQDGDTALNNAIGLLQTSVSDQETLILSIAADLVTETSDRIANDALLSASIQTLQGDVLVVAGDLASEAAFRQQADLDIGNSITMVVGYLDNEVITRGDADDAINVRLQALEGTTSRVYRVSVDPILAQANSVVWSSLTPYVANALVYRSGRAFMALQSSTNQDPYTDTTDTYWQDITEAKEGDLWISDPNIMSFYDVVLDNNDPPNITLSQWTPLSIDLSAYLNRANGGTITGPVVFSNTTVSYSNAVIELPNTNVTLDAGRYMSFNKIPNNIGMGDGGFITLDQNNFNYAMMSPATANAVANSIVANGVANTNALYEYSVLRIGTTNDQANGVNDDSIAIEPAAHLYLNPGWTGTEGARTQVRANAKVVIGNATAQMVTFAAETGDIATKGNITAVGDISALSDRSVKSNVLKIEGALDKVSALTGVSYNRIDLPGDPQHIGFIAQEVAPVVPQLVRTMPNGQMVLNYANMTALLVEAIKDLRGEVDAIKKHLGL